MRSEERAVAVVGLGHVAAASTAAGQHSKCGAAVQVLSTAALDGTSAHAKCSADVGELQVHGGMAWLL